jgi:hypothetical protein
MSVQKTGVYVARITQSPLGWQKPSWLNRLQPEGQPKGPQSSAKIQLFVGA